MFANKIVVNGETLLDLTQDTVTPETLLEGYTAHDKSGATITGTAVVSSEPTVWDGTMATSFAGGTGTEDDPYQIATAEQLSYLASATYNGSLDTTGKYFKLTADIVLNDTSNWENWATQAPANSWTPIGTSSRKFSGTFDGDGHAISGIYVKNSSYRGLFGYAENATIKNVGVVESYIKGDVYFGGVVGYNSGGTVSNCYNMGTVIGNGVYVYFGGVVGMNNSGTVSNCYNMGAVTCTGGSNVYVGGVVGRSDDGTVINCYNMGAVTCTGESKVRVGGVVGETDGTVINCYNMSAVTCTGGSNVYVGGVVGINYDTVSNCYNTGEVTGSGSYVGGLFGYSNGTVSECYYLQGTASKGLGYAGTKSSIGSFINSIANIGASDSTTLTYTGTLLEVLNQWVNANKSTYPDVKSWTNKGVSANYPTLV